MQVFRSVAEVSFQEDNGDGGAAIFLDVAVGSSGRCTQRVVDSLAMTASAAFGMVDIQMMR